MKNRSLISLVGISCVLTLFITGCFATAPVENELTWALKAANGQLSQTTANEWVAVANTISQAVPGVDVSLTEEEAQAIVDFLVANDVDTIDDLVALIEQAQADPGSIEIPDSVMTLFGEAAADAVEDLLS